MDRRFADPEQRHGRHGDAAEHRGSDDHPNGQRLSTIGTGTASLTNTGTITVTGALGTANIDAALTNTGDVAVTLGTLSLNGGGSSNAFLLATGGNGVLQFGAPAGATSGAHLHPDLRHLRRRRDHHLRQHAGRDRGLGGLLQRPPPDRLRRAAARCHRRPDQRRAHPGRHRLGQRLGHPVPLRLGHLHGLRRRLPHRRHRERQRPHPAVRHRLDRRRVRRGRRADHRERRLPHLVLRLDHARRRRSHRAEPVRHAVQRGGRHPLRHRGWRPARSRPGRQRDVGQRRRGGVLRRCGRDRHRRGGGQHRLPPGAERHAEPERRGQPRMPGT